MYIWSTYKERGTGNILTRANLRARFPETSFPADWSDTIAEFVGCDPIADVVQPQASDPVHIMERGSDILVDGIWTAQWTEIDDPNADLVAYAALLLERKWIIIRAERDARLLATDYVFLSDTFPTDACLAEFTIYRQALRDVTSQPDPDNISWPALPIYVKK